MARLSADERNQALGMLRAGMSTRNVANNFNCNRSTIVCLRQRFLATNSKVQYLPSVIDVNDWNGQ
jgi:IS30 family transposase